MEPLPFGRHDDGVAPGPLLADEATPRGAAQHCAICEKRLGNELYWLEETGDVSGPRQSWVLCKTCKDAVREQMARAPVRTPLKLRVAVGIVATERTPAARRANVGQLSDHNWERLLFWTFLLAMIAHLILIVFVAHLAR